MKHRFSITPDAITKKLGATGRDYVRELVRQRDGRTCQLCGKVWDSSMRRFDVHHLFECGDKTKAYDRIEDMDGLITFCHKCHLGLESVRRKLSNKDGHFKNSKESSQHPFYRNKKRPPEEA